MHDIVQSAKMISTHVYLDLWGQLNDATERVYKHCVISTNITLNNNALVSLNFLHDTPQYSISFHIHTIYVQDIIGH